MQNWKPLATGSGADVKEARLQLHHAVQPLAAAGVSLIAARPDYTHTSLDYDATANAFLGAALGRPAGAAQSGPEFRGALFLEDLSLALLADGATVESASLLGKTLDEAFEWLARALKAAGFAKDSKDAPLALTLPEYPDYPEHALVTQKSTFNLSLEGAAEVGRYFANTAALLQEIVDANSGASPVTTWPHHFDMATLVTLKEPSSAGGEDGRSVGAGLSPGDMGNDQPYWYVTPWPYPDKDKLPQLPAGRWNTDGWVGAQLDASEVLAAAPDGQAAAVESFLHDAVQASIDLIGRG